MIFFCGFLRLLLAAFGCDDDDDDDEFPPAALASEPDESPIPGMREIIWPILRRLARGDLGPCHGSGARIKKAIKTNARQET